MQPENREQRRHPEKLGRGGLPDKQLPDNETANERQRGADEPGVRAKSSGHGKKTADKWNQ